MKRVPASFALGNESSEALNSGQELLGRGHDASLRLGGSITDSLSPMAADGGGGDGTSMRFRVPESVVNIAHFQELIDRVTEKLKHGLAL